MIRWIWLLMISTSCKNYGHGTPLYREEDTALMPPCKRLQKIPKVHKRVGEPLSFVCSARIAGFNVSEPAGRMVWALNVRQLAHSGCGPRDPVLTMAELRKVDDEFFFSTMPGVERWSVKVPGNKLDSHQTNLQSAVIEMIVSSLEVKDSGTFRCDALVAKVTASGVEITSKSNLTTVIVTAKDTSQPNYLHVLPSEALASLDYDSSVISPKQNHRRVGQDVNVACVPRLMQSVPATTSAITRLFLRFLPFWRADSQFETVAEYYSRNNSFHKHVRNRRWKISHVKVSRKQGQELNYAGLRIGLRITNLTVQDSGIFDCGVSVENLAQSFHGEAGLKVSHSPQLQAGSCDVTEEQPDEERPDIFSSLRGAALEASAIEGKADEAEGGKKKVTIEEIFNSYKHLDKAEDKSCVAAIGIMTFAILLELVVCVRNCWQISSHFCCGSKKTGKDDKKAKEEEMGDPDKAKEMESAEKNMPMTDPLLVEEMPPV